MYTVKMTQSWAISILKDWKNVGSYWNKILWKTEKELNELLKWYKWNNPSEYLHWLLDEELELDIEWTMTKWLSKEKEREQNEILKEWKRYDCYLFARDVEWADIKALEKKVIEMWNRDDCCDFAMDVKWADIRALEKEVMKIWNRVDFSRFINEVKWADKEALEKRAIEVWDRSGCCYFAENVEWADVKALGKVVMETWGRYYCNYFMNNVKWANIMAFRISKVKKMFMWLGKMLWLN